MGPIINHENYLISSTKYKSYCIIQTDSLRLYFAEQNANTNAKHLYPKICFLEFYQNSEPAANTLGLGFNICPKQK